MWMSRLTIARTVQQSIFMGTTVSASYGTDYLIGLTKEEAEFYLTTNDVRVSGVRITAVNVVLYCGKNNCQCKMNKYVSTMI